MDIQKVIMLLDQKGLIDPKLVEWKNVEEGTSSNIIFLLEKGIPSYVIKSNEEKMIQEEVQFLQFYQGIDILPHLTYVEPSHTFIVYPFLSGETEYARNHKAELLNNLVDKMFNQYKPFQSRSGWGWTSNLVPTWREFLLGEVEGAREINSTVLTVEDIEVVYKLIESKNRDAVASERYLLHGDCGVHNFLFEQGQLCGVIDPMPLVGPPLFDFIFAFCSSPDELNWETLQSALGSFNYWNHNDALLCEEVLIGLYLRLERCIYHHPNDLNDYLQAWKYWKERGKL